MIMHVPSVMLCFSLILNTAFDGICEEISKMSQRAPGFFETGSCFLNDICTISNENINSRRITCLHFSDFGFTVSLTFTLLVHENWSVVFERFHGKVLATLQVLDACTEHTPVHYMLQNTL